MKHHLSVFLICVSLTSFSQAPYWQQQTDYKIEVTLNDTLHTLDGFVTVTYKNNSPQTLDYILFHLWPNAYRDQSTPFARQQLENRSTKFYLSKESQRGFIDHLDFKVNAEVCKWDYEDVSLEIAKLILNQPLKSGETVTISTPFRVKIPGNFSRLGHLGQSYQITQWYPKPAVFDKNGWHPMPYLDQGEFYSEFGSFDVSITLPENYVVGATGDLQNEDEKKWLDSMAEATKKIETFSDDMGFPASSSKTKTLRYTQSKIHDFGWFADKRFHVLKGEVELPYSKRKVTTWSMFTNNQAKLWTKAPEYLHDAVFYYSKWIGEYPYEQVTAVDGTISAGGGMEYPNVTIIGETRSAFSLDVVITHEVGHNWFYGILGSNERDHAWMDEGINSYYEERYISTKYPDRKMLGDFPKGIAKAFDMAQYKHKYLMDLGYQVMARENLDEPIETPSEKFRDINYGVMVYGKTMLIFHYMEAYLGTEKFDSIMKKYFETWKFKHPQPEDIRKVFEDETGKNLNWFFDDLIKTKKKIDYKIYTWQKPFENHRAVLKLKNVGEINSPVKVSFFLKDSLVHSVFLNGFNGRRSFELISFVKPQNSIPDDAIVEALESNYDSIAYNTTIFVEASKYKSVEDADKIQIDPLLQIPEINRRNNTYNLQKPAHRFEKLRFQFLGSAENQNRAQVFWAPYLAGNNYDKTQVGLAFYSPFFPARKFNYLLVPAFGTGSKQFIGFAKFSYSFYPEKSVQRFTVGVSGKRFSYILFPQVLMFNKVEPYINIEFKKKNARSPLTQSLNMRCAIIWLDWIRYDNDKKETQRYFVNEFQYRLDRNSALNPLNVKFTLRQGNSFANFTAEGNFLISYKRQNEGFRIRVFAGGFMVNFKPSSDIHAPNPRFYLSNVTNNTFAYWLQKDYMFDENFIDRNGRDKYLGRQIAKTDGAFRSFTTFGSTNNILVAANFTTSTHRFFPINPFAALAFISDDNDEARFAAEFGLSAIIIRDMIEIHLPLVTTKNITDNQKVLGITKWYQRFTFTLKWQMQRPIDLIRSFF